MILLAMSSRSSVDKAPARCLGVMGSAPTAYRELWFFLCPTLVSF